jgi:acyl-CoA oxidase
MKTVANDLDNARVWFDQVQLPKSALLNKFCDIDENDEYVQKGEKMRIEVIMPIISVHDDYCSWNEIFS